MNNFGKIDIKIATNELLEVSEQINNLLLQFVGKMETLPSYILYNILNEGKGLLKSTGNDKVVASYTSAMAVVVDAKSYSEQHIKLREITVPLTGIEKRWLNVPYYQKKPKTITKFTSDFLTSPLLQSIIFDGNVIPSVVERIHTTESDDALNALSRLILNFVKMANKEGIVALTRQNLLDGIDSILMRCQSSEGLIDAITSLQITHNIGKKIPQGMFFNWEKEFSDYHFESVLTELAVGNQNRGIAREKIKVHTPWYQRELDVQCEVDGAEELNFEDSASDGKSSEHSLMVDDEKAEGQDKSKEEKEEEKEEEKGKKSKLSKKNEGSKKKNKGKSNTKVGGKNADEKSDGEKRKKMDQQNVQIDLKTSSDSDLAEISSSASASMSSSTATQKEGKKPFLPFSVRVKAAFALINNKHEFRSIKPISNVISVLMEGIILPEGAEEEYLKRKKESSRGDVAGDEGKEDDLEANEDVIVIPIGKIDIFQIRECLMRIFMLTKEFYYSKKRQPMNIAQLKAIIPLLMRLNNFPDHLFFNLSSRCIENICSLYPNETKQLYCSSFESKLLEELDAVEAEMNKVSESINISKNEKEAKKEEVMNVSLEPVPWYQREKEFDAHKYLPYEYTKKPLLSKFESASEYELVYDLKKDQLTLERNKLSNYLTFSIGEEISRRGYNNSQKKFTCTTPLYHYSFHALHLYHLLKCLGAICKSEIKYCDEIVIRPFFERLVNRMSHPFPLIAPVSVIVLEAEAFQPQSLESVQISIDSFVMQFLTGVSKELPFVCKMGFIHTLFEWLAGGRDADSQALFYAVQYIRENSIVYMNIARETRIEVAKPFNEGVTARNNHVFTKGASIFRSAEIPQLDLVSLLDPVVCFQGLDDVYSYDYSAKKYNPIPLVNFDEDAEELEKGVDFGVYLLRSIEDEIEESGIRDIIEGNLQKDDIQLFWLCPGYLAQKKRNHVHGSVIRRSDMLNYLPHVQVETPPSDPFSPSGLTIQRSDYRFHRMYVNMVR
ncbi:uncharacterized protein MONOS_3901 [Monocercomonoides exilis]|uniref:uncharacterized protein n=1 Tax=Monocercomonoides exilis TaxID=2049356 RepID=UPI00355943E6|nr:hypothetical protein MONOS_3901 [Monocercomonoides exilis]